MEAKKTEAAKTAKKSYADTMEEVKRESKKKAFEKRDETKGVKLPISDMEKNFAMRTMPLMQNDAYKAYVEFQNHHLADRLAKAFVAPPEHWFKPTTNGEVLAFNNGLQIGMQIVRLEIERLWKMVLDQQAEEASKNDKGE